MSCLRGRRQRNWQLARVGTWGGVDSRIRASHGSGQTWTPVWDEREEREVQKPRRLAELREACLCLARYFWPTTENPSFRYAVVEKSAVADDVLQRGPSQYLPAWDANDLPFFRHDHFLSAAMLTAMVSTARPLVHSGRTTRQLIPAVPAPRFPPPDAFAN